MILHSRTKPSESYTLSKTKLLQFVPNNNNCFAIFTYSKDVFQAKENNEIGSSAGSYLKYNSRNFWYVWLTFRDCSRHLVEKL